MEKLSLNDLQQALNNVNKLLSNYCVRGLHEELEEVKKDLENQIKNYK